MSYKARHDLYGHRKAKRGLSRIVASMQANKPFMESVQQLKRHLERELILYGMVEIDGERFYLQDPKERPPSPLKILNTGPGVLTVIPPATETI